MNIVERSPSTTIVGRLMEERSISTLAKNFWEGIIHLWSSSAEELHRFIDLSPSLGSSAAEVLLHGVTSK